MAPTELRSARTNTAANEIFATWLSLSRVSRARARPKTVETPTSAEVIFVHFPAASRVFCKGSAVISSKSSSHLGLTVGFFLLFESSWEFFSLGVDITVTHYFLLYTENGFLCTIAK